MSQTHRDLQHSRDASAKRPHDDSKGRRGVSRGARRPRPPTCYGSHGWRIRTTSTYSPPRQSSCDGRGNEAGFCNPRRHTSNANQRRLVLIPTTQYRGGMRASVTRTSSRLSPSCSTHAVAYKNWQHGTIGHMQSHTRTGSMGPTTSRGQRSNLAFLFWRPAARRRRRRRTYPTLAPHGWPRPVMGPDAPN